MINNDYVNKSIKNAYDAVSPAVNNYQNSSIKQADEKKLNEEGLRTVSAVGDDKRVQKERDTANNQEEILSVDPKDKIVIKDTSVQGDKLDVTEKGNASNLAGGKVVTMSEDGIVTDKDNKPSKAAEILKEQNAKESEQAAEAKAEARAQMLKEQLMEKMSGGSSDKEETQPEDKVDNKYEIKPDKKAENKADNKPTTDESKLETNDRNVDEKNVTVEGKENQAKGTDDKKASENESTQDTKKTDDKSTGELTKKIIRDDQAIVDVQALAEAGKTEPKVPYGSDEDPAKQAKDTIDRAEILSTLMGV